MIFNKYVHENLETAVAPEQSNFIVPEKYNPEDIYNLLKEDCNGKNYDCFEKALMASTDTYGPVAALDLLSKLQIDGLINSSIDDHQIAHRIGRETAKKFGINQKSFLLCPISVYNGGCQHGYFEYVLGKTKSQVEAANLICESLDDSFSQKFKFYCYHGVGHGVMMAQAYDLRKSLDVCDSLSEHYQKDGCYQGVFMENVNAAMLGILKNNIFSEEDPLAPCNKIAEEYRQECFINHAGWLMKVFKNDINKASYSCLNAPSNHINDCIQSLGLMASNPSWQGAIIPNKPNISSEEIAWKICQKFPHQYLDQCVIGAIDNIMNFNEMDVVRGNVFCALTSQFEDICYYRIGLNLSVQSNDKNNISAKCEILDDKRNQSCRSGAGI